MRSIARTELLAHVVSLAVMATLGCDDSQPTTPSRSLEDRPPVVEPEPEVGLSFVRGPILSPFDQASTAHLVAVTARVEQRNDDVFAKVGDSATVSRAFLECFADSEDVELGAHAELGETVAFFRGGNAGARTPYRRESLAADVGWSARQVIVGDPPPLLAEVQAINPRFAFVLNGGNDVEGREPNRYANRMLRIVEKLVDRGVIPILGSITPRRDDPEAELWVRRYNLVNRGIATAKRLPYIDFHQALSALPRLGLAGDGVHPNVLARDNTAKPCVFDEEGLTHGHNTRNLLAMQMLHRLRRTVVERAEAPDPPGRALAGSGAVGAPLAVETLPFTDLRDNSTTNRTALDRYPGCDPDTDESGPENVYRLHVTETMRVRFWVYSRGDADVDIHLLRGEPTGDACVARDDAELVHELTPGDWFVSVDTFSENGDAHVGQYLLTIDVEDQAR